MKKTFIRRMAAGEKITLPVAVCKELKLQTGEMIVFTFEDEAITLRRAELLDRQFLNLSNVAFRDSNSPEDEAAFCNL